MVDCESAAIVTVMKLEKTLRIRRTCTTQYSTLQYLLVTARFQKHFQKHFLAYLILQIGCRKHYIRKTQLCTVFKG